MCVDASTACRWARFVQLCHVGGSDRHCARLRRRHRATRRQLGGRLESTHVQGLLRTPVPRQQVRSSDNSTSFHITWPSSNVDHEHTHTHTYAYTLTSNRTYACSLVLFHHTVCVVFLSRRLLCCFPIMGRVLFSTFNTLSLFPHQNCQCLESTDAHGHRQLEFPARRHPFLRVGLRHGQPGAHQ
jgi:hypothetical protein